MNPQTVADAFKAALDTQDGAQNYSFVPDAPNLPARAAFPERWPYDVTAEKTMIVWHIAGEADEQGAQSRLNDWLADTGPTSSYAALVADQSLGGVVATLLPVEIRNWGIVSLTSGLRVVQAQQVFSVWGFS